MMKYYTYISETKVNMFYDQIPSRLREKTAAELKIDLKFISTTLSEQPSEKNLITKLKLVSDYIDKHEAVGTIEKPASLFRGKMEMRWGPLYSHSQNAVLFVGQHEKYNVSVILGGSLKHVLGEKEVPTSTDSHGTSSFSNFPSLYYWLTNVNWQASQIKFADNEIALIAIVQALYNHHGPVQTVEFLAKRLLEGNAWGENVIIGSPIYVALADFDDDEEDPHKKKNWRQFWKSSAK